jgi:hypothetical protein
MEIGDGTVLEEKRNISEASEIKRVQKMNKLEMAQILLFTQKNLL